MSDDRSALVAQRLASIRGRIDDVSRRFDHDVEVVAVTKGFDDWAIEAAVAAGCRVIGENYAQELLSKRAVVDRLGPDLLDAVASQFRRRPRDRAVERGRAAQPVADVGDVLVTHFGSFSPDPEMIVTEAGRYASDSPGLAEAMVVALRAPLDRSTSPRDAVSRDRSARPRG